MEKIPTIFDVQISSPLVKINSLLSRARVRIFYKGLNRNGTYISDEVADQLVGSLPYVAVKGIFNEATEDYEDHGLSRNEGKAYGMVPSAEDMNFAWEEHLDEDGEKRFYATCDVFLWTGLYTEAQLIVDHPQSMELNPSTIVGSYIDMGAMKVYKFEKAEFFGLQCLGTDVEPCFEGAAFFSLWEEMRTMAAQISEYSKKHTKEKGGEKMELNFKLKDLGTLSSLFSTLNPSLNSEESPTLDYSIAYADDSSVIAMNHEDGKTYQMDYSLDGDIVKLGEKKEVFVMGFTEAEKNAVVSLKSEDLDSYEKVSEFFTNLQAELDGARATIEQHEATIHSLEAANSTLEEEKTALSTEASELKEFKLAKEEAERKAVVDKFATLLTEDELTAQTEKMDTFTAEELEQKLAYAVFKKQEAAKVQQFNLVPEVGGDTVYEGADAIVAKYKNKDSK